MRYDCLIIDDEKELADNTCDYFNLFGVNTHALYGVNEAKAFLDTNEVSLILLDINLQDGSGFDLCKYIRQTKQIPILFISARQSDDDVLVALNIGGDDYVKKPYTLSVLLAKVKVQLKRLAAVRDKAGKGEETDGNSAFAIDEPTMSCRVEGKEIALKAKEFALLSCLYAHKNTIVTKEQLFLQVWGDAFYSDGTLNVHIRRLREKIEEDPNHPKWIKTIWGTGYKLEIPS